MAVTIGLRQPASNAADMSLVIKGGRILQPDLTVVPGDVLVDQATGTISEIGEISPSGREVVDAAGGLVMPGLVNAHSHVAMTLLRGVADDKPLDAWLQEDIWPIEAELTAEDVRVGTQLAMVELIRSGTTAFADMYFYMDTVAEVVREAGLRAVLGHGCITVGKSDAQAREDFETGLAFAREYDGVADGRIRTAFMPHSLTTVGAEFLEEFVPRAREVDVPVHYHANETEEEVQPIVDREGQRPLEYAEELGLTASSDFIAHGVHLSDAEISVLAESGMGVVHCPASNMKLASGMAPVQALLDAGVSVGLGTDGAASNNDLDMFDEMRDAAMLGKLQTKDASAVDAASVVRMATQAGADILGFDSGRIEPGANADLIVIDLDAAHLTPKHDLVSHLAYAAKGSDVRHSVCNGQVIMRDREVLTLDSEQIQETAEQQARDLVARAAEAD